MDRGRQMSLIVAIALILIVGATAMFSHIDLVSDQELITARKAGIESMYRLRYELTSQLVATVKDAADYETGTLRALVDARAKVGQLQLPVELAPDLDALADYMAAEDGLSSAVGRLFAMSESYPQLRATESFLSLQDQIEGNENHIALAWGDYIEAIRIYNGRRRRFPSKYMADLFEFEEATTLSVDSRVREMPSISLDDEK